MASFLCGRIAEHYRFRGEVGHQRCSAQSGTLPELHFERSLGHKSSLSQHITADSPNSVFLLLLTQMALEESSGSVSLLQGRSLRSL